MPDHLGAERLHVDEIRGDAVFVFASRDDQEIPEGSGRTCPQCGKTAWLRSRFCWSCQFDFDRAALPRIHPTKIMWLSLLLNAVTALSAGWLVAASYLTGK